MVKLIQKALAMFTYMGEVLLDEANISDDCVRKILFSRFSQEELVERFEQSK
jgi:hypothetical protein